MEIRDALPLIGMPFMLIVVQLGAILLSPRMIEAGYAAFEDPSSPANPLMFIGILLFFTVIMLFMIKRGIKRVIAVIIAASIFFTFIYIFSAIGAIIPLIAPFSFPAGIVLGAAATALLYYYPEWYVIDVLGVLIAAGVASIFGISLELGPVIILLGLLAVYDAISVYKTKHMITLAEGVIEMKTPILVVMGLGDLIMPSILVVSAHVFLRGPLLFGFTTIPAVGAMIGSLAGLAVLLFFVNKGKPQAGLPSLNGGAIAGFLIACALTGTWSWIPGI
jgi:presenilin-like A22 family membrane protease